MQVVASLFGGYVQLHAPGWRVGRTATSLVDHLLGSRIIHIALDRAVGLKPVDDHSIHQDRRLSRARAMNHKVGLLHGARTAHVGNVHLNSDDELPHRLYGVGRRHRVQDFTRKDLSLEICLHVHNRRFCGDCYRFFNAAHSHLGVDCRCKVRRQFHITFYGLETGKAERYAVVARSQVDDLVRPAFIRDGRTRLLDQRRAAGFDGHPRQDRAALVLHDSCERALGKSPRARYEYKQTGDGNPLQYPHPSSFSAKPRM